MLVDGWDPSAPSSSVSNKSLFVRMNPTYKISLTTFHFQFNIYGNRDTSYNKPLYSFPPSFGEDTTTEEKGRYTINHH